MITRLVLLNRIEVSREADFHLKLGHLDFTTVVDTGQVLLSPGGNNGRVRCLQYQGSRHPGSDPLYSLIVELS